MSRHTPHHGQSLGGRSVDRCSLQGRRLRGRRARSSSTSTHAPSMPLITRRSPTSPATRPRCCKRRPTWRAIRPTPNIRTPGQRYGELFNAGVISKDQAEQLRRRRGRQRPGSQCRPGRHRQRRGGHRRQPGHRRITPRSNSATPPSIRPSTGARQPHGETGNVVTRNDGYDIHSMRWTTLPCFTVRFAGAPVDGR